jgi:hypothetical protein
MRCILCGLLATLLALTAGCGGANKGVEKPEKFAPAPTGKPLEQ